MDTDTNTSFVSGRGDENSLLVPVTGSRVGSGARSLPSTPIHTAYMPGSEVSQFNLAPASNQSQGFTTPNAAPGRFQPNVSSIQGFSDFAQPSQPGYLMPHVSVRPAMRSS